jgi:hypothetical protein
MIFRRLMAWLTRPLAPRPPRTLQEKQDRIHPMGVDREVKLSDAVGSNGGGGTAAGRSFVRSGAGLGSR